MRSLQGLTRRDFPSDWPVTYHKPPEAATGEACGAAGIGRSKLRAGNRSRFSRGEISPRRAALAAYVTAGANLLAAAAMGRLAASGTPRSGPGSRSPDLHTCRGIMPAGRVAGSCGTWPLVALSVPPWSAGACLTGATLRHCASAQVTSTMVLMPLFILWSALMGRWLQTREA